MKKFVSLFAIICSASAFAAPANASPQGSMVQTLIMIGIAIAFFYLILWRPEQKRRKEALKLRESLKAGDKVTAMGIVGTVSQVKETTVIVQMVDGAKIEFLKGAISEIQSNKEEKK